MLVIIGLLLTTFFGLQVSYLLLPKMHNIERLGLAYVLGIGLFTLIMTGFLFGGVAMTNSSILITLVLLNLALFPLAKKRMGDFKKDLIASFSLRDFSRSEKFVFILLILINLYALIISAYWPVKDWDAVTLYDFRAKLIANPQTVNNYVNIKYDGYYYGYPLLTSLTHSFVYILNGENPLFLSGLFFVSFSLLFYGALRKFTTRIVGLLATLILVTNYSLVQHVSTAYTNLPYSMYFSIGTIYLYTWMQKREQGYLILSSILTMLSIWVRDSEPFWIANLLVLGIYSLKERKIYAPILYLVIVSPIRFIWGALKDRVSDYVTSGQFQKSLSIMGSGLDISRMFQVVSFLEVAIAPLFLPVIALFLSFILIDYRRLINSKRIYLALLILANFGILFIGTYIFSFTFRDWMKIPGSVERIFMFFPALILFYVASVLSLQREEITSLRKL